MTARLSPQLRRYRRRRVALAAAFGVLWSVCLLILSAALGSRWVTFDLDLPWYAGIVGGVLSSAALARVRASARRLRIRAAAAGFRRQVATPRVRAAVAVAALTGASGISLSTAAEQARAVGHECVILVSGQGVSGPGRFDASTVGDPIVIDLRSDPVLDVGWRLPDGADVSGSALRIMAQSGPVAVELLQVTVAGGTEGYRSEVPPGFMPGRYLVRVELTGPDGTTLCDPQVGWVQLEGPLLASPLVWGSGAGLLAGLAGTLLVAFRTRVDAWSFTAPGGITVEIVDPARGRPVREPLVRGRRYVARVTVDWPDPPRAYAALTEPLEVVVGFFGSTAPLGTAPLPAGSARPAEVDLTLPENAPAADSASPSLAAAMQLNIDLTLHHQPQQSVRILQHATGRVNIPSATGEVVYDLGELTAARLKDQRPVDCAIGMHSGAGGEQLEIWGQRSVDGMRFVFRRQVPRPVLAELAEAYRHQLLASSKVWIGRSSSVERRAALGDLAVAGARLRRALIGPGGPLVPFDATVAISHDVDALAEMTFPWGGLHLGDLDPEIPLVHCEGMPGAPCIRAWSARGADDTPPHDPQVVCPWDFWGIRYELVWPGGWLPSPPVGGGRSRRSATITNDVPVRIVTVSSLPAEVRSGLDDELRGLGVPLGTAVQQQVHETLAGWRQDFASHNETDVLLLVGHGGRLGDGSYALRFEHDLTEHTLSQVARGRSLVHGPLVLMTSCDSGVVGLSESHRLLSGLHDLGVGGAVVAETKIYAPDALSADAHVLSGLMAGCYASRAILDARRVDLLETGRLTWLALTYYGPAGLRLARPVPVRPGCEAVASGTPRLWPKEHHEPAR